MHIPRSEIHEDGAVAAPAKPVATIFKLERPTRVGDIGVAVGRHMYAIDVKACLS